MTLSKIPVDPLITGFFFPSVTTEISSTMNVDNKRENYMYRGFGTNSAATGLSETAQLKLCAGFAAIPKMCRVVCGVIIHPGLSRQQ